MSFEEWSNKKKTKEREQTGSVPARINSGNKTTASSFSEWSDNKHVNRIDGLKGWELYQTEKKLYADGQKAKKKAEEEARNNESFWEKLGRWLGESQDTTLPLGTVPSVVHDMSETTAEEAQLQALFSFDTDNYTDEQKKEFGRLYKEDIKAAAEYAKAIELGKAEEFATDNIGTGALHTAGSVLASPITGMADFLYDLAQGAARGEIITETPSLFEYSQAGTQAITKDLNEIGTLYEGIPVIGGKGLGDVYGIGTSIAQSALAAVTGGGLQATATFFGSAAASGVDDALSRGATSDQAIAFGFVSGIAEAAAEYLPTEMLLGNAGKSFFKAIGSQMIAEGFEEGATSIATNIADNIINGENSQFNHLVLAYMEGGMSREDAVKKAWVQTFEDVAFDSLAGALSGGISGAVFTGASTAISDTQAGKNIINRAEAAENFDSVAALKTLAYEMAGDQKTFADKQLAKTAGKIDYTNLKARNVGKTHRLVSNSIAEQNNANIKSAVESRLTELGEKGDVAQLAEIITKQTRGENLTLSEKSALKKSQFAARVSNELDPDNIQAGTHSSAWTNSIKTSSINDRLYESLNKAADAETQTPVQETTPEVMKGEHKVSESGKTLYTNESGETEEVGIQKIVSTEGGIKVALDNGKTVNAKDLELSTDAEAMAFEMVTRMETNPETAQLIFEAVKASDATSAEELFLGVPTAYRYGKINYEAGLANLAIPDAIKKLAYNRGKQDAMTSPHGEKKSAPKQTKKTNAKKGETKQYSKVIFEGFEYSEDSATDIQKASMKAIDALSQTTNFLEIHVYESKVENGKRYAIVDGEKIFANGFFKRGTNKVYIDINAGNKGEGAMLYTLGHESVHPIAEWNWEGFKELGDFLIENFGRNNVPVDQLIEEKKRILIEGFKRDGVAIPSDEKLYMAAYEEVVADSMVSMPSDPNTYAKIAELKKQNKNAWQMLKDIINVILDKLKSILGVYDGVSYESKEAEHVAKFSKDVYDKLQDLYIKAFVGAEANYQAAQRDGTANKHLKNRQIAYNERAVESHKVKLEEQYSNDASIDLDTLMKRYEKIISIWKSLGGELDSKFLNEWNNKVGKDRAFTVFKAQSGYKYNVELSSMCKKGVPLFEAIDTIVKEEVMKELDTDVLGKAEKEILYDILKSHSFEIPCAICYVEQARQREGAIIDAFLNGKVEKDSKGKTKTFKLGWNEVLKDVEKEMKALGVDYTFQAVDRAIATDKYVPADISMDATTQEAFYNALKKVANKEITRYNKEEGKSRKLVNAVTPAAIKEVFKGTLPSNLKIFKVLFTDPSARFTLESDLLYSSMTTHNLATAHNALYSLFNSQGGVSGYKTKQGTVVYWGDILGKTWKPSAVRDEGGIRNQSNSDFQMYTLLDQAQMYIDFSAKGYYLQAYTKVLSELKLFGLSRGKINASLIPAVYEYRNADGTIDIEATKENAGLDKNGDLLFDDIEGINHKEAFMLLEDAEYSKSIGGICIGYSDNHIFKLLDDQRVQQIIGFHDKTDDPDKRYRGARYAKNYNGLNEAINKEGKTVHIGFNPYVRKAEKMFTFNAETETYAGEIEYNGKTYVADDIPKLAADLYLEMCEKKGYTPAYTDFDFHENYYKLLADFSLYDSQGHYAPHRKVAYNMPDKVPYLDINGKKQYMPTKDYIKAELEKELQVRDAISEALADKSENGIIPQFKKRVNNERETLSEAAERMATISAEDYLKEKEQRPFVLVMSRTPQIILDSMKGSMDRGVLIRKDALYLAIRESGVQEGHYHGLGAKALADLPKYLEAPDVILATDDTSTKKESEKRRLVLTHIQSKNGQAIISVEFESPKDFEGEHDYYNIVITVFDLHEGYLKKLFRKLNATIKYEKEDLAQVNPQLYKWLRSINARSSDKIVPQDSEVVKKKFSERNSYSERDSTYMDAVKRGDMETAQRMVDEAAKEAGYDTDAYHGTNQGDFNVFDWDKTQRADGGFFGRGHYFTKSEGMAKLYGKRIVKGKLKLGKTFVWSEAINSYKGKRPPELLSRNIVSRINMAKTFPDIFANQTMSYWEYDTKKGDNVEKTIKWGELEGIVNSLSKGLTLRAYADGTYKWHTEGRFWEVPVGESYSSVEKANEGKFFAAINALKEKYEGLFSDMSFDDQTTYTQQYGTEITETLKKNGYTSAMDTPEGGEIVVFDSNQIKSAAPVTYDDNGDVIPLSKRFDAENSDIRYQERDPDSISNRSLLANALESAAKEGEERNILRNYKTKLRLIEAEQAKLADVREKARDLRFKKGRTAEETKALNGLDFEAKQIANRINTYDRELLKIEAMKPIKDVLNREKQKAYKRAEQKGKEALKAQRERASENYKKLLAEHQESRKKAIEGRHKTEMRHKIKKVVGDLNNLLLHPTKDNHVPIGLQLVVADALDAINMDTMNAAERVAYYNDRIAKSNNPDEIEMLTKKRDFFEYRDMNFKDKVTALKNAYAEFKNSDDPLIRNAHNEAIADLIENTSDAVGKKSLKDMSYEQLEAVYNMYKAILATVRNANKMFKEGRQETITESSEAVKTEVKEVGGHKDRVLKATKFLKKFGWDMLKPVTAMKVIGSDTLASLFDNVRAGEDTWAVDVSEAKAYYEDVSTKYRYKDWDLKKHYSFKDSAGNNFSLSLEQIMSLYAYSKRDQADKHLEFGGFIFDDAIEVTEKTKIGIPMKYEVNDANPYRLRREDLLAVIESLTAEQKGFVDEMQRYLSDVMGAKGNEVSLAMYDIKLYNEKNYFPLKTSRYFREFDPEKSGTPKIKNAGFSKKTVPQAGNPIVLSNFMDVWANHVNDMSMYHAFVLPLEDFTRVYNYSSTAGGYDSVQQYIKNAYGAQANQYVEKLLDDLNGGARVDSSAGVINKGLSLFKKASVFASASVVVQQPSAIARAFAYVNPKYFAAATGSALNLANHKELWAEVKKYAPVTVIKEMGYFDTGIGRSSVDWIKGNQTIWDKADDVLSKAPAIADELAWSHIWAAVKREVKATTNLKEGTEEFLKKAGARFTEVIVNTQVYDSVLSRSGMMRSKDTGMKMATAFMAEPTTTANMMIDGIIQGKRGNKKFLAATVGGVSASIVLNSILVALVYAARDDDEDETYVEKYLGSITSELLDGFNPLTYIPFVKDIWSIAQGYDVERSDMTVVSNLWESIERMFNENTSGWEKVADVSGAVSSLFGIPLKNIIRDAKGLYNLFEAVTSGIPTTEAGIADSVEDAFTSSIPLWDRFHESETNSDKLYEAIMSGDQAQIDRIKGRFKDEEAIYSAIRESAKDAYIEGDLSRSEAEKMLVSHGNLDGDDAYWKLKEWDYYKENGTDEGYSKYNSFYDAVQTGRNLKAVISEYTSHGVEAKTLASQITKYFKPLYKEMSNSERASIKGYLLNAYVQLGYSRAEKSKDINAWLKD